MTGSDVVTIFMLVVILMFDGFVIHGSRKAQLQQRKTRLQQRIIELEHEVLDGPLDHGEECWDCECDRRSTSKYLQA